MPHGRVGKVQRNEDQALLRQLGVRRFREDEARAHTADTRSAVGEGSSGAPPAHSSPRSGRPVRRRRPGSRPQRSCSSAGAASSRPRRPAKRRAPGRRTARPERRSTLPGDCPHAIDWLSDAACRRDVNLVQTALVCSRRTLHSGEGKGKALSSPCPEEGRVLGLYARASPQLLLRREEAAGASGETSQGRTVCPNTSTSGDRQRHHQFLVVIRAEPHLLRRLHLVSAASSVRREPRQFAPPKLTYNSWCGLYVRRSDREHQADPSSR